MLQADMNFTIESVLTEPCNYGTFVEADNSSTGLMKPLTEGRADLTTVMYTDHLRLQVASFVPIRKDHIKLISGKARDTSSSILEVFASDYWKCLLVFVLANALLLVMFSALSERRGVFLRHLLRGLALTRRAHADLLLETRS